MTATEPTPADRAATPADRAATPADRAATPADRAAEAPPGRHHGLDLSRIAWIVTTAVLLVGVLVLALKRDWGYAAVSLAVALSAAINLT